MREQRPQMKVQMGGSRHGRDPGGMISGEKPKNFKQTLKRLINYLRPYRVSFTLVILAAAVGTLFTVISPVLLGSATTHIFEGLMSKKSGLGGIDFQFLAQLLMVLLGLYLLASLFTYITAYIMAGISQKVVYQLRKEATEKVSRLPLQYFDKNQTGDILSRIVNDVDNISNTLQQTLTQMITSVITLVGVIFMMIKLSGLLTVILLVTLPVSVLFIQIIVRRSQKYFKGQQESLGRVNAHIEEMYSGYLVVKAFGQEKNSEKQFQVLNDTLYENGWKAQFISGMIMPFMTFVGNIGYVLIAVVGGVLVMKEALKVGDIQAFIQYARQFNQPITQVANISNIIQSTIASAERVFEILDETEEEDDGMQKISNNLQLGAHVQFEHVTFGYDAKDVIQDLNLEVFPGQMVAIVGPTGAGKTTLVNLMMRFYELKDGRILLNGIDIRTLKRKELYQMFGMVVQDTWLFEGTIGENISYGHPNASKEELIAASKAACADYFIRTLPDGYDTKINASASNLSEGQKQLLTIARALLADPQILILDEATSNVDTRTEVQIQKAMNTLMKGRTSFVIAHRLSTIRDADLILVMKKGCVIEQGSHDELIRKQGFYYELYQSQFSNGLE